MTSFSSLFDSLSPRNCFSEAVLGLTFGDFEPDARDLFSVACVEEYIEEKHENHLYKFAQVFEPYVLKEICLLAKLDYLEVSTLRHLESTHLNDLAIAAESAHQLSVTSAVNLAATLISIMRFAPAQAILNDALPRASNARQVFEIQMLQFVVANRCGKKSVIDDCFTAMRAAITTEQLPNSRILDAAAQAIVWFQKSRDISPENYRWFTEIGVQITRADLTLDPGTLSTWYRAYAMVPAGEGRPNETRAIMLRAQETALAAMELRPRAYERHFLKTYFESTMKEHIYVSRDIARAIEAGEKLIAIDPNWGVSYGELAEVYVRVGEHRKAAELFWRAARSGPPYVAHHAFFAAQCYATCGEIEKASQITDILVGLDPTNQTVTRFARSLATNSTTGTHYSDAAFVQEVSR